MSAINTLLTMLVALALWRATAAPAADGCVILLHGLGRDGTQEALMPAEVLT